MGGAILKPLKPLNYGTYSGQPNLYKSYLSSQSAGSTEHIHISVQQTPKQALSDRAVVA
jgi:hypothetical protein